jgi:K+-transporting ATPase KdpF subunit
VSACINSIAGIGTSKSMTTILLWLLIIAIGVYLLIAMLRPDKF